MNITVPVLAFLFLGTQAYASEDPCDVKPLVEELPVSRICSIDAASKKLTMADVVNLALCNNPQTKYLYTSALQKAASLGEAKASYLPTVDLNASVSQSDRNVINHNELDSNSSNLSGALSLNWLLYDFGGRSANTEIVRQALVSALHTRSDTLQNLIFDVAQAYYRLFAAQEGYENSQATVEAAKSAYDAASKRYELGLAALSDKLQAETSYSQAQLTAAEAEEALSLAKGKLSVLLNYPPQKSFLLEPEPYTLENMTIDDNVENLLNVALEKRADILAKKADLKQALINVDYEKAQNLPSFSVSAGLDAADDLTRGGHKDYASRVGLSMSVPLFTGFKNQYRVTRARYAAEQKRAELKELENTVQTDVWETFQTFQTAKKTHEISLTLLKSAQQSANVALGAYKAGKGNILNVLDAQSKLAEARTSKSRSFYLLLISKSNLIRSMGLIEPFKSEKGL